MRLKADRLWNLGKLGKNRSVIITRRIKELLKFHTVCRVSPGKRESRKLLINNKKRKRKTKKLTTEETFSQHSVCTGWLKCRANCIETTARIRIAWLFDHPVCETQHRRPRGLAPRVCDRSPRLLWRSRSNRRERSFCRRIPETGAGEEHRLRRRKYAQRAGDCLRWLRGQLLCRLTVERDFGTDRLRVKGSYGSKYLRMSCFSRRKLWWRRKRRLWWRWRI